jgi:hypothetical protein
MRSFLALCAEVERMTVRDCYKSLGVNNNAPLHIIHKAYMDGIRTWHPDKCNNPRAAVKFQEIYESHDTLMDPIKRRSHDEALAAAAAAPSAPAASPPPSSAPATSSPGDLLTALASSKVPLTLPELRLLSAKCGVPWPQDSSERSEVLAKLSRNAYYLIDAKVFRGEWSKLTIKDVVHWLDFRGFNLKYDDAMMMTKCDVFKLAKSLNARSWYEKAPSAPRQKRRATKFDKKNITGKRRAKFDKKNIAGKRRAKFDRSFAAFSSGPAEAQKGREVRQHRDDAGNGMHKRRSSSSSAKSSPYAPAAVWAKKKTEFFKETKKCLDELRSHLEAHRSRASGCDQSILPVVKKLESIDREGKIDVHMLKVTRLIVELNKPWWRLHSHGAVGQRTTSLLRGWMNRVGAK